LYHFNSYAIKKNFGEQEITLALLNLFMKDVWESPKNNRPLKLHIFKNVEFITMMENITKRIYRSIQRLINFNTKMLIYFCTLWEMTVWYTDKYGIEKCCLLWKGFE
jgi:hypothetical protein